MDNEQNISSDAAINAFLNGSDEESKPEAPVDIDDAISDDKEEPLKKKRTPPRSKKVKDEPLEEIDEENNSDYISDDDDDSGKDKEDEDEDGDGREDDRPSKSKSRNKEKAPEEKIKSLEKQLKDTRSWGHENNKALVLTQKKVRDFLSSKVKDGSPILEEDLNEMMNAFKTGEQDIAEAIEVPPVETRGQRIDKALKDEFKMLKKYGRVENADEKFGIFYRAFTLYSPEEREQTLDYLENSKPDKALNYVMDIGEDLFKLHHKGIMKFEDNIVDYMDHLATDNLKKDKKIKELEAELDETTENFVYNKKINPGVTKNRFSSKPQSAVAAFLE